MTGATAIPNFGNNGYVQPKTNFDWSFLWYIFGAIILFFVFHFAMKQAKKKEGNPPLEPPVNNMPPQVQPA